MFKDEGQFHGMVYFVAALLMLPGIWLSNELKLHTCRIDPGHLEANSHVAVELQ